MFKQKLLYSFYITVALLISVSKFIDGFSLSNIGLFKKKVEISRLHVFNNESSPFQLYVSYRKFNRTNLAITANVTITDLIDKRYQFKLEVQKWGDGGWKRNLLLYENNDPCKQLKLTLGPAFKAIMDLLKHPPNCPFRPGFYHVDDLPSDDNVEPIYFNLGKQKLLIDFFKDSAWLNHFEQELDITEIN